MTDHGFEGWEAGMDGAVENVDVEGLRDLLDGRWAHVRRAVRDRVPAEYLHSTADLDTEAHRALVTRRLREMAAAGHSSTGFPVEFGGADDIGGGVVSFEMLGFADLSLMVKSGVQWGLFGGAVQNLGTRPHHERYLPAIIAADLLGCFAMTETGHGSDVASIATTATYDPDTGQFVVHTPHEGARKDYIGNAARDGQVAVVFAQLVTGGERRGVHALLVPIRTADGTPAPGVTIADDGRKAGLNGVDNGRLLFDQVRVPRDALLNRYGDVAADGTYSSPIESPQRRFFTMLGALVRGRVSVAGGAGSATKVALAIAVRYAEVRRQFAAPGGDAEVVLLDYRAHQRRLLPALATTYALHFAQEDLVSMLHDTQLGGVTDEQRQRELEARAAGLKAIATWHASATIQTAREACGGAGYLAENRLPQLRADTDVFTTFEGDNTVLLQLVAKGLLTSYREHVGDLDTLGTVRFVADQVLGAVAERTSARALLDRLTALAPGRRDAEDMRAAVWQLRMFADRETHQLEGLARRLRRAGEPGADLFAVFNDAQDHLLRLAHAHVALEVLQSFAAAVERCPDPGLARLLGTVRDLYALAEIEADLGWYLAHGRLTTARAKQVTSTVNDLCAELRPYARTLVDGFGIPDGWLTAEIADGGEARRQDAARRHRESAPAPEPTSAAAATPATTA
jgi:acyl-CoA oxidase